MTHSEHGPWTPGATLPTAFFEVARQLYQDQPEWIPESESGLQALFSTSNPWFDQGRAWLGVNGHAARLAGFFNPTLRVDGDSVAFFGFFESINDPNASADLFEQLSRWARAQGAQRLYGPINFTTFSSYRIRLDHFQSPPFPGEPFNPSWYPSLLEELGFTLRYRYATRINRDVNALLPKVQQYYAPLREQIHSRFHIDTLNGDFWRGHLEQIYTLVDSIFSDNFAYSSIDYHTFVAQCGEPFAERLCPHSSVVAFDKQKKLAGFFLCFPDYGPLMQQGSPHRCTDQSIRFDSHYSQLPTPRLALAKTGGVHPNYRQDGLFSALSCELTLRLAPHYQQVAGAMVREDNRSLNFAARFGDEAHHYGLYSRSLQVTT